MAWNFFRPREKFLILEITPKGTNGLSLSVDEDRNLVFEKFARHSDLKKLLKTLARRRVIAAADSSLATTIPVPLELFRERANTKTKVTVAELENLIAQAMARIFNGARREAAKRLKGDELNAILVGARVKHFKVDGKTFASPVGVAGKKVSLLLELTFTTREIFEDLKPLFNAPEGFFFAEAPQAHLSALSRIRALPLNLIVADDDGASLYVLEKPKGEHAVLYREELAWSFSSFLKRITEELAVSEGAARGLYCLYQRGEISEGARKAFKKTIAPALEALFKAMERGRIRGAVYIDIPHALPLKLPHKHRAVTLEEHPIGELLAELGFALPAGAALGEDKNAVLRSLLYFIEAYFDKSNSEINQKLRRRLHWLAR